MAVCAASRRLNLSNAIQGLYRVEIARQYSEKFAVNLYKSQRHLTTISTNTFHAPQRSFSTSRVHLNGGAGSSLDVKTRHESLGDDVLIELTSTKARNQSRNPNNSKAQKASKKHSEKSANGEKKSNKEKKAAIKSTLHPHRPDGKRKSEPWQIQKEALKEKFEEGWHPRKKLPPDTLDTIRHLHATKPDDWTTPVLAEQFKVSPEAIRRILKSKWQPSNDERQKRQDRWEKRHERIWSHMEELGLRPKKGERTADLSDARRLGLASPSSTVPSD